MMKATFNFKSLFKQYKILTDLPKPAQLGLSSALDPEVCF